MGRKTSERRVEKGVCVKVCVCVYEGEYVWGREGGLERVMLGEHEQGTMVYI